MNKQNIKCENKTSVVDTHKDEKMKTQGRRASQVEYKNLEWNRFGIASPKRYHQARHHLRSVQSNRAPYSSHQETGPMGKA
jgi:hypothetical protein